MTTFPYDEGYFTKLYAKRFYRWYLGVRNKFIRDIVTHYVPSGRFLEIGFGDDNLCKHFLDSFDVHGVDISEFAVSQIRRSYEPGRFQVCDVCKEDIPFSGGFDVICAVNTVEHFADPAAALANVSRSLKTGGIFVAYLPTASNLVSRLQYRLFYDVREHVFRPSVASLNNLLSSLGLYKMEEYIASFLPARVTNRWVINSFNLYLGVWGK